MRYNDNVMLTRINYLKKLVLSLQTLHQEFNISFNFLYNVFEFVLNFYLFTILFFNFFKGFLTQK